MLLTGISGCWRSGKTTVVDRFLEQFPRCQVLVIPQGGENRVAVEVLASIIRERLNGR